MKLKCGRDIINLTNKDVVAFNGAAYMVWTQKKTTYWGSGGGVPIIAKNKAEKMINKGILVEAGHIQGNVLKLVRYNVNINGHEEEEW